MSTCGSSTGRPVVARDRTYGSGCSSCRQRASHARWALATTAFGKLDELQRATGRLPAVNQIEWSPALFDRNVLAAHRRLGVQLEGYSPLRTVSLRDPQLVRIAEDHGVTPAQVVLRWHIEHRIVAIPKSTNAGRIAENAAIFDFELTPSEVEQLDRLADTPP